MLLHLRRCDVVSSRVLDYCTAERYVHIFCLCDHLLSGIASLGWWYLMASRAFEAAPPLRDETRLRPHLSKMRMRSLAWCFLHWQPHVGRCVLE